MKNEVSTIFPEKWEKGNKITRFFSTILLYKDIGGFSKVLFLKLVFVCLSVQS